jgi:hypothetical protein
MGISWEVSWYIGSYHETMDKYGNTRGNTTKYREIPPADMIKRCDFLGIPN